MKRRTARRLALAALALAAAELSSRAGFSLLRTKTGSASSSTLNRIAWANSSPVHRQLGDSGIFRYDEVLGWLPRPGLDRRHVRARLSTNSEGVRGKTEFRLEKDPRRPRVQFYGDSYTFGHGVSDEETYPQRLQALLPGYEVMNLGVPGFGHDQMLLYFGKAGARYRPDVVAIGFSPVDMHRNMQDFNVYAKPRFRLRGGALEAAGRPVPPPDRTLAEEFWRPKALDLCRALYESGRFGGRDYLERRAELTEALLRRFRQEAAAAGARLLLVYLPSDWEGDGRDPHEAWLLDLAAREGVAAVTARPALAEAAARGERLRLPSGHYTAEGNRLVARTLRDHFEASTKKGVK